MAYKYVVTIKADTLDSLKSAMEIADEAVRSFILSDEGKSGKAYSVTITSDKID